MIFLSPAGLKGDYEMMSVRVCVRACVSHADFSKTTTATDFYPTALKGCRGIVFTHGVRMGGRVGGRREIVCPGCISETVRCRKLILGRDIG